MIDRPRIRFMVEEAKLGGFVVQVDGEIFAAFSDASGLANWVERHCRETEIEPVAGEVHDQFPNVIRARTGPKQGWFNRG